MGAARGKSGSGYPHGTWANARMGGRCLLAPDRQATPISSARLLAEDDPSVFALSYAADDEADPFAVKPRGTRPTRRCATGCLILTVLRAEARMAKRDPAELATFRKFEIEPRHQ